jgi:hypothetical protein
MKFLTKCKNIGIAITLLVATGCNLAGSSRDSQLLEQTRVAIGQQLTQQAIEIQLTRPAQIQATQNAQSTILAQQATQYAQRVTLAAVASTATQNASQQKNTATPTVQTTPATNIDTQIKAAKILLYENMSGQKIYGVYWPRYVQAALDRAGYSYTNVGSALGWFKNSLLTSNDWDLIIASSEATNKLQGEYFTYILDHLNRGAAVILEVWDLDLIGTGTVAPILEKCGIGLYSDWLNASSLALWELVPDHPIFHYPNDGISMRNAAPFWWNDQGDLLKTTGKGDAQLLLGTIATQKSDHGTLVTCLNGRLLIQTFRSHSYGMVEMESLWENYVYFVLKSKFESQNK